MTMTNLSPAAADALKKIEALREFPVAATEKAVQKILNRLSLKDLTDVTSLLVERDGGAR